MGVLVVGVRVRLLRALNGVVVAVREVGGVAVGDRDHDVRLHVLWNGHQHCFHGDLAVRIVVWRRRCHRNIVCVLFSRSEYRNGVCNRHAITTVGSEVVRVAANRKPGTPINERPSAA